ITREYQGHSGSVLGVSPCPTGPYFLTGGTDQVMNIFHIERAEPLVSLFVAGREWIAWTPEGYYAASAYGERLMGWLINNRAVRSMRLLVDGRPWKGLNEVRSFPDQPGEVQASWQVELPPGNHHLVVLADSSVSRGVSAAVEVNSSGAGVEQPSLYVLAMG